MDDMDDMDDILDLIGPVDTYTMDEAEKKIKTFVFGPGRSSLFIRANVDLPIVGGEDKNQSTYFPGLTLVPVPMPVAIEYVNDMLRDFEQRGARIRIRHSRHCMFIG